ncbi:hypothetical protein BaRGS_00023342 [Batillaria attramentaria]|uniref:Uncharacterized protein n=1 Tax=Batillaria attramentaria TaxID=370345 RepID=A0ABD0KE53_9CAEN
MICFSISQNKLTACLAHYMKHGVTPPEEWGGRKFNSKAFKPEDIQNTDRFIQNFAEDCALVLPGRIPGFKRSDIQILPSAYTKAAVWEHYRRLMQARGLRAMGKSSFFNTWAEYTPYIVVGKPMSDLCWALQPEQRADTTNSTPARGRANAAPAEATPPSPGG